MKPSVTDAAREIAEQLRSDIAPELSGFRANNVAMAAQMIDMLAEQWDGMAARLVEENSRIRSLLTQGGRAVAEECDSDLRISALERANAWLRAALIELHAAVEGQASSEARRLEHEIWLELARSVERRRVSSANF